MSDKVKLLFGLLALMSLPALSACDTGRGAGEDLPVTGEGRGTNTVGEEGISGEATPGDIEEEDIGASGQAGEAAGASDVDEEEEGTSGQVTTGTAAPSGAAAGSTGAQGASSAEAGEGSERAAQ